MKTIYISIEQEQTGKRIRELMHLNDLKVKDIQVACGFEHPQAVYKWMNGECLPSIDNLCVLAYIFKTTIDGILVKSGDAAFILSQKYITVINLHKQV